MSETEETKNTVSDPVSTMKTEEGKEEEEEKSMDAPLPPTATPPPSEELSKSTSSQDVSMSEAAPPTAPTIKMEEPPSPAVPAIPEPSVTSQPTTSGDTAEADSQSKDDSAMSVESGEVEEKEMTCPTEKEEVDKATTTAYDGESSSKTEGEKGSGETETKKEGPEEQNTTKEESPPAESQSEEPDGSKAELPYSTRGRTTTTATEPPAAAATAAAAAAVVGGESWERSSREALDDIARVKDPTPTTLGTSFLESLSEEERRTRTRFLPDVEGMHSLRKTEVKGDLALARSIASGTGVTSLAPSKKSKSGKQRPRNEDDGMEVEEDEDTPPSEDDRGSDSARTGASTIEIGKITLTVPSIAFVPPPPQTSSSLNGEDGASSSSSKSRNELLSPLLVEAVTAFDPPRPAESVGAKKKHRMLRWERRPEDLEVDLSNYRKTVQRTRQELHKAEAECERLETIDSHLRRHFLGHLNALNEEYYRLNEELGQVQQECVAAADLLTSRTRSRGAGKGSYVMRDVLTVLKSRGAEMAEKGVEPEESMFSEEGKPAGFGGLSGLAFTDWIQSTKISPKKPANAWILPGDKVLTPYGKGTVTDVYSFSSPNGSTVPFDTTGGLSSKGSKTNETQKSPQKSPGSKRKDEPRTKSPKKSPSKDAPSTAILDNPTLPPRVKVQLQYGTGYFNLEAIQSMEEPCFYSDAQLAKRWQQMFATASEVGPCLDVEGMAAPWEPSVAVPTKNNDDSDDPGNDEASSMEVDGEDSPRPEATQAEEAVDVKSKTRFLPFGAGLLPTATGRANLFHKLAITDIEKEIHSALFDGGGVLGKPTNIGVTPDVKTAEEQYQEYCTLQASALQVRNELYRQRRIRLLNERTYEATKDRSLKVEALVSEMRTDLKSLKLRLEEELHELGIDEETADEIFLSFYREQDLRDAEESEVSSPPKRERRLSRTEDDDGMMDDTSGDGEQYLDEGHRDAGSDNGTDDLSGDDLEIHRAPKKQKVDQ